MARVSPSISLNEYNTFFEEMIVDESKRNEIDAAVKLIEKGKDRYVSVTFKMNSRCPWYALGIVHYMESACNFKHHIHNGDPLTGRTIQVPKGRPLAAPKFGSTYTWEESAMDWFVYKNWHRWMDWQPKDILYRLELNNGMGYRNRQLATPYLWSYTNHYEKGKFVKDGKFDSGAVSKQVGAAVLLKEFLNFV